MKTIDHNLLKKITRRLIAEFQPEQIILFGSYAWGTPAEDSDIDLLVIVPESEMSPVRRAVRAHRCLIGLNISKDVLVKTRAEVERFRYVYASLECEILERGRVLYESSQARIGAELVDQGAA